MSHLDHAHPFKLAITALYIPLATLNTVASSMTQAVIPTPVYSMTMCICNYQSEVEESYSPPPYSPSQATPAFPHGIREIFVVNLQVVSTVGVAAGVDPAFSQAVVEPFGVIQLGASSFIVLEGEQVDITVWRRFGSQGNIRVTAMAMVASEASIPPEAVTATPTADFPTQPVSLSISDGAPNGVISVPIPDNNMQEQVRVFQFALTAVERDPPTAGLFTSPRLSTQSLSALVSITDDEGGSGIFQFSSTTSIQVAESGNVTVVVGVARGRSTIGRVRLQLTSFDGSISNSGGCI